MTKLILHIGAHKTGTTALQNFLALNYEQLLSYGVLYPRFSANIAVPHHIIMRPIVAPKNNDYIWSIEGVDNIRTELDIRDAIHREVDETGAHTVIMSTEFLFVNKPIFNNIAEGNLARYAKRLFSGFDVEVVVYLRNQPDWLESCYIEAVKGAHTCYEHDIKEYILYRHPEYMDYREYLEPWLDAFGRERIHVRIYERAAGAIEKDVINNIGLFFPADTMWNVPDVDESNISLNRVAIRILRYFNQLNNSRDEGEKYIFPLGWKELREYALVGRQSYLSCAERRKLYALLSDKNRRLAELVGLQDSEMKLWDAAFLQESKEDKNGNDIESDKAVNIFFLVEHSARQATDILLLRNERDSLFSVAEQRLAEINRLVSEVRLYKKILFPISAIIHLIRRIKGYLGQ